MADAGSGRLGTLRVERDPSVDPGAADASEETFVTLEGPTAARLPKEYVVNASVGSAPAAAFSCSGDGRFAVEGKVTRKGDLQALDLKSKEYKALMRERLLSTQRKKHVVDLDGKARPKAILLPKKQVRNKNRHDRKAIAGVGAWETRTRQAYTEEQLRDLLFAYFEKKECWTFREIFAAFDREHGDAPHAYVREVLNDICDQFRDGAKAMQYSLKSEYAVNVHGPAETVKDETFS
uniref:TFIIF beta subunit HTH domain-containing protein n=1 Tax=Prasinoderma coloniale TaxID=156133 RepID=A0A7R9Y0U7_9VIRI